MYYSCVVILQFVKSCEALAKEKCTYYVMNFGYKYGVKWLRDYELSIGC